MQVTKSQPFSEQTTRIRALSSLTGRDAASVRAAVRSTGNRYRVEEHDDYDGYLSLLLTPDEAGRCAFLVSGRVGAVDLAALQGDEMTGLGRFPSVGAAMLALRTALGADASGSADAAAPCLPPAMIAGAR